jgi:hypothetical protein
MIRRYVAVELGRIIDNAREKKWPSNSLCSVKHSVHHHHSDMPNFTYTIPKIAVKDWEEAPHHDLCQSQ